MIGVDCCPKGKCGIAKRLKVRLIDIINFAMADLLSIPFEVHVLIVRELSLKDCIAYMQVCTVAHDVVYYVFAHRKELDFESVLDESGTIALCPEMLMKVLYAHTGRRLNTGAKCSAMEPME